MKFSVPLFGTVSAALALLLSNCASTPATPAVDAQGNAVNPHTPGSYEHFTADKSYPKTSKSWKNDGLLAKTDASNSHIVVSLGKQRAFFMNGDQVVIDYPISSGTRSHPTPPGEYTILEKLVDKSSNSYGKIYDAEGKVVVSDADARKDTVPEGGKFVGAPMPYWMRLTWDGVGHHIGVVKRYPASHACIRGPRGVVPVVYGKVAKGTRVSIVK